MESSGKGGRSEGCRRLRSSERREERFGNIVVGLCGSVWL